MISVFDLFTIGIGPSSSHTVGPMRAASQFLQALTDQGLFDQIDRIEVNLYGSLALTGVGHGTDKALLLAFSGKTPETADPEKVPEFLQSIRASGQIKLLEKKQIDFQEERDLLFHKKKTLPLHSNGMCFKAFSADGKTLLEEIYYSVGGGFIASDAQMKNKQDPGASAPFPFETGEALLKLCKQEQKSIAEIVMENEKSWREESAVIEGVEKIWSAMKGCVEAGCRKTGILPGGLGVKRRAPDLFERLNKESDPTPATIMEWVSLYALAVNEENAAGGRVVTAPTNGAAGILPAVLHYLFNHHKKNAGKQDLVNFMLSAAAIGFLFKKGASLSAAEVGCQGEVGVACSMAAAGLAAALGGTPAQVENAAEIGMEHNLGLTCDPVNGLVQIPCIERNTMGAVKAITAAMLALKGDGEHIISLDKVIATMYQTGKDMLNIYKETSEGGLAVNIVEC